MQNGEMEAPPKDEQCCLVTARVHATSANEARELIETGEWISDLSGWSGRITPIFSWLKKGRIYRVDIISIAPSIREKSFSVTQSFIPFDVTCWLIGSAPTKAAFKQYIDSRFWLVNSRVEVVSVSDAYTAHEVEMERFVG